MEAKFTATPDDNRRVLRALAASMRVYDREASQMLKENELQTNTTLLIDLLTLIERRSGLPVEFFRLVTLAKIAIVSGDYAPYWDANARLEGLIE